MGIPHLIFLITKMKLSEVPLIPPDSIFNLVTLYKECKDPKKVNLTIGAYRDEDGKPYVLKVVQQAEKALTTTHQTNKEYLPIVGLPEFNKVAKELMFSAEMVEKYPDRIATIQSISGTGSLRLALEFLRKSFKDLCVYLPEPTWANHDQMLNEMGVSFKKYRYYDPKTLAVNIDWMIKDLKNVPKGSVVLLHECAQNPTGADPSPEQWKTIADIVVERNLFPLFDVAYQGYVTGNPDTDGLALHTFVERDIDMICCQSFAKIFGLYCERTGAVHVVVNSKNAKQTCKAVLSQFERLARTLYSNPPAWGARIVAHVLSDPDLKAAWYIELAVMADRIVKMRHLLRKALEKVEAGGKDYDWSHVTEQKGMFCFTGLNAKTVEYLTEKKSIFLLKSGRISIPGLTEKNVDYVAESIRDALNENL